MPAYQSFPYRSGASDSPGKLARLYLPPLAGKSFLDVGCNEGYFCGFAFFDGAAKTVGIDLKADALATARRLFPQCDFRAQNWDDLDPGEHFDVILCSSALHYADHQEKLIHKLAAHLNPDGVLVLEAGIAPGRTPEWREVQRSIDTRLFPTQTLLESILAPYAWKYMGDSVPQPGDPLPRMVYHIRRKRPYLILLLQEPGSGKTSLRKELFGHCPAISGDVLVARIAAGQEACSPALRACVEQVYKPDKIGLAMARICEQHLLTDYLELVLAHAEGRTTVYDGYIPEAYRQQVEHFFAARAYMPVLPAWTNPYNNGSRGTRARQEARQYQMYLAAILNKSQLGK